jgi:hypothetical protein
MPGTCRGRPGEWLERDRRLRFEVLQHRLVDVLPRRRVQVRIWPLDLQFGYDSATPEIEAGWRQAKASLPDRGSPLCPHRARRPVGKS